MATNSTAAAPQASDWSGLARPAQLVSSASLARSDISTNLSPCSSLGPQAGNGADGPVNIPELIALSTFGGLSSSSAITAPAAGSGGSSGMPTPVSGISGTPAAGGSSGMPTPVNSSSGTPAAGGNSGVHTPVNSSSGTPVIGGNSGVLTPVSGGSGTPVVGSNSGMPTPVSGSSGTPAIGGSSGTSIPGSGSSITAIGRSSGTRTGASSSGMAAIGGSNGMTTNVSSSGSTAGASGRSMAISGAAASGGSSNTTARAGSSSVAPGGGNIGTATGASSNSMAATGGSGGTAGAGGTTLQQQQQQQNPADSRMDSGSELWCSNLSQYMTLWSTLIIVNTLLVSASVSPMSAPPMPDLLNSWAVTKWSLKTCIFTHGLLWTITLLANINALMICIAMLGILLQQRSTEHITAFLNTTQVSLVFPPGSGVCYGGLFSIDTIEFPFFIAAPLKSLPAFSTMFGVIVGLTAVVWTAFILYGKVVGIVGLCWVCLTICWLSMIVQLHAIQP